MIESTGDGGFGRWRVEGCPFLVEYAHETLEALRAEAVEGLFKLAKGGLEVGGVLFGERSGDLVRVLAARPLACEHASGPAFLLSDKDEENLTAIAGSVASDPGLKGLIPVGWYHSHTRSGLALSEQDLEISRRHFPEPWQVALLLHPGRTAPTRVGFFFGDFGSPDFALQPLPKQKKAAPAAGTRVERPVETPAAVEEPPEVVVPPARSNRLPWTLFALAWCVAFAATAIALRSIWMSQTAPTAPAVPPAQMVEAVQRAEQLQREVDRLRAELQVEIEKNKAIIPKRKRPAQSNEGRSKR